MSTIEQLAEDAIADMGSALCDVMATALVEKGISPAVARALAERACKPAARSGARATVQTVKKTAKRAKSAYSRKYKAAFKKIAPKYKLKSGKWKAGGFKAAVKAAHKAVKK